MMPRLGHHLKPRTAIEPPSVAGARWLPLTHGRFALVDATDFDRLNAKSWVYHVIHGHAFRKGPVGTIPKQIALHREVLGITDPKVYVDHRSGNRLDCRRDNLRPATQQENGRNNAGHARRQSTYKGVSPSGRTSKPWAAKITVNSKTMNLGRFTSEEDAARAYDAAAIKHFGTFARVNFPDLVNDNGISRATDVLFPERT